MSIKTFIANGDGGKISNAEVTPNHALKVATLDYYNYLNEVRFFTNSIHGINMNIDASSTTGEIIHNGGDTAAWIGSTLAGTTVNFNAINNPYEGTYNIQAITLALGTTFQIKRSSIINLTSYNSLTGHFYLTTLGNPISELLIYGYNTSLGVTVGNSVNLYDYINTGNTGTYQSFNIPLNDMGLINTNIDAFRFNVAAKGGAIFDMDNLSLNVANVGGGSKDFILQTRNAEILVVNDINFYIVDNYDGVTGTNGIQKLEYNKILGEALNEGIIYRRYHNGEVLFSVTLRDISDFLSIPNIEIKNYSSDGTNTLMNIVYKFFEPFVLDSADDHIVLTVNDNLTGFLKFIASSNCKSVVAITGSKSDAIIEDPKNQWLSFGKG